MKLKRSRRLSSHVLFCVLHSLRSLRSSLNACSEASLAAYDLGSYASDCDQPCIANRLWIQSGEIRCRRECMCHRIRPSSLGVDKCRNGNQMCNHLGIQINASAQKADDAASQSTKCRRQAPWLSRLMLLGLCVYGPVLPMWYLSTIAIPAPMCLLLATQAWLSGGLCLLASSWLDDLYSPQNAHVHRPQQHQA